MQDNDIIEKILSGNSVNIPAGTTLPDQCIRLTDNNGITLIKYIFVEGDERVFTNLIKTQGFIPISRDFYDIVKDVTGAFKVEISGNMMTLSIPAKLPKAIRDRWKLRMRYPPVLCDVESLPTVLDKFPPHVVPSIYNGSSGCALLGTANVPSSNKVLVTPTLMGLFPESENELRDYLLKAKGGIYETFTERKFKML